MSGEFATDVADALGGHKGVEPSEREARHREGQPARRTLKGQDEDRQHGPIEEEDEHREEARQQVEGQLPFSGGRLHLVQARTHVRMYIHT